MIHVTKVGDLTFEVRIDDCHREYLSAASGRTPPERAIEHILSEALLGFDWQAHLFEDLPEYIWHFGPNPPDD